MWETSCTSPPAHLPAFPFWPRDSSKSSVPSLTLATPATLTRETSTGSTLDTEMGYSGSDQTNRSDRAGSRDYEYAFDVADHGRKSSDANNNQLMVRGKGTYTCPHGLDCRKGGVQDGQVRIFVRNSDFRYVCLRYVCPLPDPLPSQPFWLAVQKAFPPAPKPPIIACGLHHHQVQSECHNGFRYHVVWYNS